jgi:hypothetical protein
LSSGIEPAELPPEARGARVGRHGLLVGVEIAPQRGEELLA